MALEGPPLPNVSGNALRPFVMRIVDVLDDSLSGVKDVVVRDMMEEQHQFIRSGFERLVNPCDLRGILPDKTGTRGHRSVHPDAFVVGAMPLSPAIFFR